MIHRLHCQYLILLPLVFWFWLPLAFVSQVLARLMLEPALSFIISFSLLDAGLIFSSLSSSFFVCFAVCCSLLLPHIMVEPMNVFSLSFFFPSTFFTSHHSAHRDSLSSFYLALLCLFFPLLPSPFVSLHFFIAPSSFSFCFFLPLMFVCFWFVFSAPLLSSYWCIEATCASVPPQSIPLLRECSIISVHFDSKLMRALDILEATNDCWGKPIIIYRNDWKASLFELDERSACISQLHGFRPLAFCFWTTISFCNETTTWSSLLKRNWSATTWSWQRVIWWKNTTAKTNTSQAKKRKWCANARQRT